VQTYAELLAAAEVQNPEIASARKMIERQSLQVDLARKDFYPTSMCSICGSAPTHAVSRLLHAQRRVRVPIYRGRKQRPELAQAEAEKLRAGSELQAQSQQIAAELRAQYMLAQQTSELLKIHREGLSPQSRSEFQAALATYQSNKQDFQALLAAFLDVLRLDEEYWQNVAEYETAIARLEQITDCRYAKKEIEHANYRNPFVFALVGNLALLAVLSGLCALEAAPEDRRCHAAASTESAQSSPTEGERSDGTARSSLIPFSFLRNDSKASASGAAVWKTGPSTTRSTSRAMSRLMRRAFPPCRCGTPATSKKSLRTPRINIFAKASAFHHLQPGLVATEREYLVAKQNQQRVAQSTIPGVTEALLRSWRRKRTAETMGRSTARNRAPRIHGRNPTGTPGRFTGFWLHHRA